MKESKNEIRQEKSTEIEKTYLIKKNNKEKKIRGIENIIKLVIRTLLGLFSFFTVLDLRNSLKKLDTFNSIDINNNKLLYTNVILKIGLYLTTLISLLVAFVLYLATSRFFETILSVIFFV